MQTINEQNVVIAFRAPYSVDKPERYSKGLVGSSAESVLVRT